MQRAPNINASVLVGTVPASEEIKFCFFYLDGLICTTMPEYKVEVTTGEWKWAGTRNYVYVTIRGNKGQSEPTKLDNWGPDFTRGGVSWKRAASLHE